jgi:hypothetical protein
MKKILLAITLIVSFVSFGQNNFKLGNYTKLKKNNIEIQYKKPQPPFQKVEESYSVGGNANLVIAYNAFTSGNIVILQVYATPLPEQFRDFDWQAMIRSDKRSRQFIKSFIGGNKIMKISNHKLKNMKGKVFLEVTSTTTVSGITQKQVNFLTIFKKNLINILGVTLIDSFDKNVSFIEEFSHSILIK